MKDLRQIPVVIVFARIADLLERDPGTLSPVFQRRRIGICRQQRAKRRRPKLVHHVLNCFAVLTWGHCLADDVQVDGTEDNVIGLVSRPDVLDESRIGIGPRIVLLPAQSGVPPGNFHEDHEPLLVQVINFPIDVMEVLWIDSLYIGKHVLVPGHLSREQKRPTSFVLHVLGAAGAEF